MPTLTLNPHLLTLGYLLLAPLFAGCARDRPTQPQQDSSRPAGSAIARPPELPARQPGPPRAETAAQLAGARSEAARLAESLTQGGVAAREVASVCDIRGYRLYRRRQYNQALAWFEQALRLDPGFEPAIYNAARASALLGRPGPARAYLQQLRQRGSPLARGYLARSRRDPDLLTQHSGAD